MARYIVHYYVVNDVVTETPMGGADWINKQFIEFHKIFKHNKISKALETFKRLVDSEKARWKEFNRLNNDEYNSSEIRIKTKDERGICKYFFEASGLGYVMHGSPVCISRIWIEDTASFKEKNNYIRSKRIENQRRIDFNRELQENAFKFKRVGDKLINTDTGKDIMDELPFN